MSRPDVIGVYRETRFSPGRVADDEAILDRTAEELRRLGCSVEMIRADALPANEPQAALVFAMCQGTEALAWLDRLAERCPVVNRPAAVRNCYRSRMVERFSAAGVRQPGWRLAGDRLPAELGPGPWLKRGDVHAMEAGDVRRVFTEADWSRAVEDFSERGIEKAIIQAHAEGEVYKFYGAAGGFFRAFGLAEDRTEAAAELAAAGARALGLEVYGGDGVSGPDGSLALIDFNDWPSFSRCRSDAAAAIARRLCAILERKNLDGIEEDSPRARASRP